MGLPVIARLWVAARDSYLYSPGFGAIQVLPGPFVCKDAIGIYQITKDAISIYVNGVYSVSLC